ncbi:MAG: NAD(P)H-hydrate dehydratase [Gammaproteobacteria bacterium]
MSEAASSVWTPEAVRKLDRTASENCGIASFELMQRAADAVCSVAQARWPEAQRWLVLCGGGNNGGDGYLVACLARRSGHDVQVCALADPANLTGDAAAAWQAYASDGGTLQPFVEKLPDEADLVIDALLGIGLTRPVTGDYLAAIDAVNASATPVVAVDIPSGLDATTGHPLPRAIRADCTVTFVGHKLGLFVGEGPACTGELHFADLGIPSGVVEQAGLSGTATLRLFTHKDLLPLLPKRVATDHKGRFGHVLVIGGNTGMSGAVRLAGEAALRSGAGLVSVATRRAHAELLAMVRPELMVHGIGTVDELQPLLSRATVIAVGPGLGQDEWARTILDAVLATRLPLVVDADALNLLAGMNIQRSDWIITPHPGEAARLLGRSAADIQYDRPAALTALIERYGGTVLLKGKGTLVGADGTTRWLIAAGNPGMATAGMGDVLTGIVAAFVAQGLAAAHSFDDLAAAAAHVHGIAGDAAAQAGQRGLLATDLLGNLRPWLNP